jgi:hypothetical protein
MAACCCTRKKGWFIGNSTAGNLVFTRVDGPDVERARRMVALRDSVLVYSIEGWFVARERNGRVTFAHAGPFETTNLAEQFHELPGGAVLVGSLKGLFVVRPSEDSPAVARVEEPETGYIFMMRETTGGNALVGAQENFFTAHDENGKIRLTPVSSDDRETGRVLTQPRYPGFSSQELPDKTILFGAQNGLFAATPRACPIR